jgi:hypothetical protein
MKTSLDLPSIPELRRVAQSLAMLDAILCSEWDSRYYSFNGAWGPGEEMASMRNGEGDDWFLLFDPAGAAIKGFAHELADGSSFARNIQHQVPADLSSFLDEPAFSMQRATFCYWRKSDDASWNKVSGFPSDDGASDLLALLFSGPSGYKEWAEHYYEMPVALDAVIAIFSHRPLDDSLVLSLNPDADLDFIHTEAQEIAYPCVAP